MEKEQMIKIPLSRYDELLDLETRTVLLKEYTQRTKYSVSREDIALYLHFQLRQGMDEESFCGKENKEDGKCDHSKET